MRKYLLIATVLVIVVIAPLIGYTYVQQTRQGVGATTPTKSVVVTQDFMHGLVK